MAKKKDSSKAGPGRKAAPRLVKLAFQTAARPGGSALRKVR